MFEHAALKDREELLTVSEVAEALKTPKSWVYSSVRSGRIPYIKVGKYLRFRISEVISALEAK